MTEVEIDNKVQEIKRKFDVMDFLGYVDEMNSGHDRGVVFTYMEEYLKEDKGIDIPITMTELYRKWGECEEDLEW